MLPSTEVGVIHSNKPEALEYLLVALARTVPSMSSASFVSEHIHMYVGVSHMLGGHQSTAVKCVYQCLKGIILCPFY